jgi:predicted PurR-regulated permease PerM
VTRRQHLKDGRRIAGWVNGLFAERQRRDVERMSVLAWGVLGGFIRGQLIIAAADGAAVALFQLEAHILSPLVLGRSVRLHPLAIVVVLACGVALHGVIGALLAVPMTACAVRVASYLRSRTVVDHDGDVAAMVPPSVG